MKVPKNSLPLSKPTRDTREIANKFMTVASGEISLQSKHNPICHVHVAKVKAATTVHSMADVIPFLAYLLFFSNPML